MGASAFYHFCIKRTVVRSFGFHVNWNVRTAPEGISVINPAFDETPPELVSSIITEAGIAKPPYEESIKNLFKSTAD